MAEEEDSHRAALIARHRARFGESIPLIRREHVRGYFERKPDWLVRPLGIEKVRTQAEAMERQAGSFYREAAKRTSDASTRKLLGDLVAAEKLHESLARRLERNMCSIATRREEGATEHRQFLLTYVQPGLAGLMDGSVSTLAPIFAAAFATHDTWQTFLWGFRPPSARAFLWALPKSHDDGRLSGRGSPVKRGLTTGMMTAVGGLGHALPYLIRIFDGDARSGGRRFVELWAITLIQNRYMETPCGRAAMQVVLGGALV